MRGLLSTFLVLLSAISTEALDYSLPRAVAQRAQQLSKYKDVATGQGYRSREALGAARLEQHMQGRKLTPGPITSVDWVDQKLGDISFKGPLVDDSNYDGILESFPHGFDMNSVQNAVRRDLSENSEASTLVIDTLGMSEGEVRFFEGAVKGFANPYNKAVLLLLEKEMKSLNTNGDPSAFDRYPNR